MWAFKKVLYLSEFEYWATTSLTDFSNLSFCVLQIKKLKGQLEEKQKNGKMENSQSEDEVLENGTDMHMIDLQSKLHVDF